MRIKMVKLRFPLTVVAERGSHVLTRVKPVLVYSLYKIVDTHTSYKMMNMK